MKGKSGGENDTVRYYFFGSGWLEGGYMFLLCKSLNILGSQI